MEKEHNSLFNLSCLIVFLAVTLSSIIFDSHLASAARYNYQVPYIKQLDYSYPNVGKSESIGESACAPTCLTMLLQYYYPNSGVNVPEIYHSGIQGYSYHGPAPGYKNVSFQPPDPGLNIVDKQFRSFYSGDYSGLASPEAAACYLKYIWGGQSYGGNALFNEKVINEIRKGPLILNIRYNNKPAWGHYILLRGYDDGGTPTNYSDDKFYVNDPYTKWPGHPNGENREFDYVTLSSWYKGRIITFEPTLSQEQAKYTVVVDNTHVQLDDIDAKDANGTYIWWEYYGPGNGSCRGDWYYPKKEGHWARWNPNFLVDGIYKIYMIFRKDQKQSNVNYVIYKPNGEPIEVVTISQKGEGWCTANLGSFSLKKGSYVQIDNVPAQCNVDAIRFEYFSPPSSGRVSVDLDTKYWEETPDWPGGKYQLRIIAEATPGSVSSITISGPCIDTVTYSYSGGQRCFILDTKEPPRVGQTITFYIKYQDNSSETISKTIDGVFTETPVLVSPPDGSTVNTLTPTFEWRNLSISGLIYSVQIDDINHTTRVYSVYDLPDGTTSHRIPSGYLNWGTTYYWLVSGSDPNGNEALTNWDTFTTSGTAASTTAIGQPKFSLSQNYPNPFNPETTIEYDIEKDCDVTLKIYNLAGQLVKTLVDEYQTAGHYAITWYGDTDAGQEIASGVYFYRIKAGDKAAIKKMVVLK